VTSVAELGEIKGDEIELNPVFEFEQFGAGENGEVLGEFVSSGESGLLRRFQAAGVPMHPAVLRGSAR
jgi:hypothetical protein